jgi:hypothetical protein
MAYNVFNTYAFFGQYKYNLQKNLNETERVFDHHTLGYGFKKSEEIYILAFGFLFFVTSILGHSFQLSKEDFG